MSTAGRKERPAAGRPPSRDYQGERVTTSTDPRLSYPLWAVTYGWAAQEVAGTEHYLPAILAMTGDVTLNGSDFIARTVQLVPEPDNDFDPTAVSVRYHDNLIGYLPADDASKYHQPLLRLLELGFMPTVEARTWISERTSWDEFGNSERTEYATVRLLLSGPETMVPLNDPPQDDYTILPIGHSVQVLKTVEHFETLRRYPVTDGTASLLAELHGVEPSGRSTKEVVEVRLDGERIGQLSPAMSEKFLPALRHFRERGLVTCARAVLKASPVSAKVTLHAQKAFELSADELNGEPTTVPSRGVTPPTGAANPLDEPAADTVQSGVTSQGSTVTVTERPRVGIITVLFEYRVPPTAWQQKILRKVLAKADSLMRQDQLTADSPTVFNDKQLEGHVPLGSGQEFVDALIGIEDSDFTEAEEFCANG